MAPTPDPPVSICVTGKEEANAQRDDHEEITREAVAVGKGSRDRRDVARQIKIEDVTVAGEKFEHSVKGFENTHEENGNKEVMRYPIPVIREPPLEEKNKKAREDQPAT